MTSQITWLLMVAFEVGVQICYGSLDVWPFYGGSLGQNTSQYPKHFPEPKNISQNPNTSQNSKTLARIKKTLPRIQHMSQNPKTLLNSGKCFWILGRVLDSRKCFGFWEVFLDSGNCFGFWEVFCPYGPRNHSVKTFWSH